MKFKLSSAISIFNISIFILFITITQTQAQKISPPWSKLTQDGKMFTVPGVDNVPDLHGDINNPDLVVFFAGNQFMVVPDLVKAFKKEYPQYKRIFVETLPPGILLDQIKENAIIIGNMRISIKPDIFTAGKGHVKEVQKKDHLFNKTVDYARNRLAIMVYKGNPKNITSLKDLANPELRVSMPNPNWEGIAKIIIRTYKKAGGKKLVDAIMGNKVKDGTTFLTHIHHRQTPMRIMEKKADAGPVWFTEANFQKMIGNPISLVQIPSKDNIDVTYTAASLLNAPHPKAAQDFLDFLKSKKCSEIYQKFGFMPVHK
jgi:ABC-type molybdate transport system substrate-binding protein